jgi:outer membrane protein assembly factor BamA
LSAQLKGQIFFSANWTCIFLLISCCIYAQNDTALNTPRILPFPVVTRSIETNWAFGAVVSGTFHLKSSRDSATRTSNLQALALYSINNQFVAAINGSIYFPGEKFILNQQFSYSYFPDKFWGVGNNTANSNKEPYDYKQLYIYLHPQMHLGHSYFLGILYEFQNVWDVQFVPGGLFDKENIVGRYGYLVSGLGISITYDTRNNAFSPNRGAMLQFYFNHFAPVFGSDYQYTNYVLDCRKYFNTHRGQVLALQAYGFFNTGTVPFRSLAAFGGANRMRGFYEGRYRDNDQAILQAEYRIPLFWRLGMVGFAGVGNVASKLNDFDLTYIKYSLGGGIRVALNQSERLNLRLDYGVGEGSAHGFYFQLGEAF